MLVFIGLGLHGNENLSLEGLNEVREADEVYAELYTSLLPNLDLRELERLVGKPIRVVSREIVEQRPTEILEAAKAGRVAFLVPGDPMVATTHVDLRLRAARMGIRTRIVHASSIVSAVAGLSGLQIYKFGRSATIPFPEIPSRVPYETLAENSERGLHTLLLLDLRAEEKRFMSANQAIELMLGLESELGRGFFTLRTLAVVIARAGCADSVISADRVERLRELDFAPLPHVLIVPGKLHFLEAEALRVFAGAPLEVTR